MMRQTTEHNSQAERGQSLVEFALSLVFLLVLVGGIFDAARALFTYLALRDAAQEGALYGSVYPDQIAAIRTRVCNASNMLAGLCQADNPANGAGFEVQVAPTVSGKFCNGSTGGVNHGIRVTVDYPNFPLTMPVIGQVIGGGDYEVHMTATIQDTIIRPMCSP